MHCVCPVCELHRLDYSPPLKALSRRWKTLVSTWYTNTDGQKCKMLSQARMTADRKMQGRYVCITGKHKEAGEVFRLSWEMYLEWCGTS